MSYYSAENEPAFVGILAPLFFRVKKLIGPRTACCGNVFFIAVHRVSRKIEPRHLLFHSEKVAFRKFGNVGQVKINTEIVAYIK